MEEVVREVENIDKELKRKIRKTVKKILEGSSLYKMTEMKAREEASSELELDLSQDPYKDIVREAVESFIEEAIKVMGNKIVKIQNYRNEDDEETKRMKLKKKKKKKKKKSTTTTDT